MKWTKLGDVCEITGAGVDKKIVPGEKEIRLLNYMDVHRNAYLNNQTATMVVTASDKKIKQCDVKYSDIFITPTSETVDDIFRSAVATENMQGVVYSYHIMRLRLKEPNFTTACYLSYLFQCENFRKNIYKITYGNTRKMIAKGDLNALQIPIPPMDEQSRIVGVLDTFEALKSNLNTELSQRIKQYNHYRDEILNPERLGQINGAKLMPLSEFAIFKDGTHQTPKYQDSGVLFISVENIKNIYESQKFISQEDFDKYKFKPQIGDIFMTRIGVIGECAIMERNMDLAYYVTLALIRTNKELVNPRFLRHCIESVWGKSELNKYTLHNAYPKKINLGEIGRLKFIIPPLDEQARIVGILDTFDALIDNIRAEINQRTKQARYYKEQLLSFDKS